MELKLMNDYVLIRDEENPFQKLKTESGLILPSGLIESNETGEVEQMNRIIGFGVIIEVGDKTKYLKKGDGVYYDRRSVRPIPFNGTNSWHINEGNIMAFVPDENGSVEQAVVDYKEKDEVERNKTASAFQDRAGKIGLTLAP